MLPVPFVAKKTVLLSSKLVDDVLDQVEAALGSARKVLAKQATEKIHEITDKDSYEIGDLSKWLDTKARATVADLTN